MPKATPQQRLEVLARWRSEALAAGHPVPPEEFIRDFADAGPEFRPELEASKNAIVVSWLPTLLFFAKQWKLGNVLPDLPTMLKVPVGDDAPVEPAPPAETSASPSPSEAEPSTPEPSTPEPSTPEPSTPEPSTPASAIATRFEALKQWRAGLDPSTVGSLKESHLRTISRTDFVTEAEVASSLPNSVSKLARAIADVLAGLATPASADPPPSEPEPAKTAAAKEPANPDSAAAQSPKAAAPQTTTNDVSPDGFAAFNLIPVGGTPGAITGGGTDDTGIALRWEPYKTRDSVVLYRVVSLDDSPPYSPDPAHLIVSTMRLTATDARPFTAGVRYVQVWVNSGPSVDEAKANQPVLHAHAEFVAPPYHLSIREDGGRVIASWESWPQTTRIVVYRVPRERALTESGAHEHRILTDELNLNGFVDEKPPSGAWYLYQIVAEASVDGIGQRATAVVREVFVPKVLESVTDMSKQIRGDEEPLVDLTWTMPEGSQVVIYRTANPPAPGSDLTVIPEAGLSQANLLEADRLPYPVTRLGDGTATMQSVPLPSGWARAYFTPVTLLNGQALPGVPLVVNNPRRIELARVVERVNMEMLAFAWPEGAASVFVYESMKGQPAEAAVQGNQAVEITKEEWMHYGGLPFSRQLPTVGCDLHLVPVMFYAGERITGVPTTVNYEGIKRLTYSVKQVRRLGALTGVSVNVQAQDPVLKPPPFVLVHNPERLPLGMRDGTVLTVVPEATEGAPPAKRITFPGGLTPAPSAEWRTPPEAWKLEVGTARGYVRLFVDVTPEVNQLIALVDPAPADLRVQSLMEKLGGVGR